MEWIEVTGRTLEEAIERALDSLGVHETELEYEVVTEPKTTLLGLRRTEARIRARVKPRSREKPNDKRRRQRDEQRSRRRGGRERVAAADATAGGGGGGGRAAAGTKTTNAGRQTGSATGGAGRGGGQNGQAGQGGEGVEDGSDAAAGGSGSSSARRRRRRRGSGGQGSSAGQGAATTTKAGAPSSGAPEDDTEHEEQRVMERSGSIEEQVEAGRQFAVGLLDAFEAQGTVSVEPEDNEIEVKIDGDNLGLLVGPKGATLAALEELLRGAVGHRGPGRVHLDVAGYRAKRRAALAEFARRVAEDVRASGSAKALEPMSAPDRKVVHDTVAEIDGVSTISDGEDPRRRVIIQPA